MGEYADMEIDQAMGLDDLDWLFARPSRPRQRSTPKPQVCNLCQRPVIYNARGEKMEGGSVHRCPPVVPGRRLSLDDLADGT